MNDERPEEYRPSFAKHVLGIIPPRVWDEDDRVFEEQKIRVTCETCKVSALLVCVSGRARDKVARFALGHMHRDVLRNPGSGPCK